MAGRHKPSAYKRTVPPIDAGNSPLTTDQRGSTRPIELPVANASGGNGSDIGAFERNEPPQSGANFVVNKTDDHDDGVCGATDCTLREAIGASNANADTSNITFSPTVFNTARTITLDAALGELVVSAGLTIDGPDDVITTISGNNASRVLRVTSGTSTMDDLVIANGNGVGGDFGRVGRVQGATLSLSRCVVTGGSSSQGGGIYVNSSTLNLSNCTLARNNGGNQGGAIDNNGGGTTNISNCTITDNTANNGGGIYNPGSAPVNINNSIVAGNSTRAGPDIFNSITSGGFNLIGKTDRSGGFVASDKTGTSAQPLDPKFELDASNGNIPFLKDNGGGTLSIALLPGSTAINAGNPGVGISASSYDQLGASFLRVRRGRLNIGAYEEQNERPSNAPISRSTDEDTTFIFTASDFTAVFSVPDAGDTLNRIRHYEPTRQRHAQAGREQRHPQSGNCRLGPGHALLRASCRRFGIGLLRLCGGGCLRFCG